MVADSRKAAEDVIVRPPPLAHASRFGGERSLPPRARRAPRSATAARCVASPRAAWTSGEAAHSRSDARSDGFEKGRSGGRHAAADDDALDAEGQGERSDGSGQVVGHPVGDLERDLVAGRSGAEDISGTRMGRQDGAPTGGDRLVGLASDRRDRRRSSRGSRADRTRRRRRPDRRRCGPPRRQSCCRRGARLRRERRRPRSRSRSRGRRRLPAPEPTRRPTCSLSQRAAARASCSTKIGTPSSVCSIGPRGRWVIPRLTAMLTEPSSGSTWPGMATPTAAMSCPKWRRASSTRPAIWSTSDDRSVGATCS